MLEPEPAAGTAKAGDDFIGNQQDVVPIANLADTGEVIRRWNDDAAGTLHRFSDERRHRVGAFAQNRLLELICRRDPDAYRGIARDESIRVGGLDV